MEFDCTYSLQSRGLGRSSNEIDNVNKIVYQLKIMEINYPEYGHIVQATMF